MTEKVKVTIERISKDRASVHSSTREDFVDAFYHSMESSWGFGNYMEVLIAEAVANDCFDKKGRDLLRAFLRHRDCKAGSGVDWIANLYEMALGPDDEPDD